MCRVMSLFERVISLLEPGHGMVGREKCISHTHTGSGVFEQHTGTLNASQSAVSVVLRNGVPEEQRRFRMNEGGQVALWGLSVSEAGHNMVIQYD